MIPHRAFAIAAACCLVGFAARAQHPAPSGPHVTDGKPVDADAIRRVGNWLQATNSPNTFNDIAQDALRMFREGNFRDFQSIAERLKANNPVLNNPAAREQFLRDFNELGSKVGQPPIESPSSDVSPPVTPPSEPPSRPNPSVERTPPPVTSGPPRDDPNPSPLPRGLPFNPFSQIPPPGFDPGRDHRPEFRPHPHGPGPHIRRRDRHEPDPLAMPEEPAPREDVGQDGPTAEELERRRQQYETLAKFWEKNVGKLDDTPAVRELLREMIAGNAPLDANAAEGLSALLGDPKADPNGFVKWISSQSDLFDRITPSSLRGFRFRDWSLPTINRPSAPSLPSFGSGGKGSAGGWMSGDSWWPVVLFVAVALAALLAWWYRGRASLFSAARPEALSDLGRWPIDPRLIADRADVVRAFEYLSVALCGTAARAWNHMAIAAALKAATGEADAAEPLARLYALARYAPAGEAFPPDAVAEARRFLCRLAGVPAP